MAAMSDSTQSISSGSTQSMPAAAEEAVPVVEAPSVQADLTEGTLVVQTLERPLRPGEVSLDELERAFRETETEVAAPAPAAKPAAAAPAAEPTEAAKKPARKAAGEDVQEGDKIANQSIRVNVDTLEHLMTMVSELVLTRNQLLEISRRNEDTEFKVPLQRLSNVTAELQEGV
ncbi:hybrid sensor histidine kinase/response regulator, partial [Bradyrhizobium sp. Mp19]|nr:hybrid sensor histidine kinase/response regulator [Bradyrhizobium sp. Mp19]